MKSTLKQAIFDKLFVPDGKRFVVAVNRDGVLLSEEARKSIEKEFGAKVFSGDSLDLRIVRETVVRKDPDEFVIFATKSSIRLLDDIAEDCTVVNIQFRSFFPNYPWDKVKEMSFDKMAWLYEQPGYVYLEAPSSGLLQDNSVDNTETAESKLESLKLAWSFNMDKLDFNKPTEWMNRASEILLSVIEDDFLDEFQDEVAEANRLFEEFLKKSYVNIVSSTCGLKAPRIVTQVLPFISKQKDDKIALVVVDGMNYWQALLLTRSIEKKLGVSSHYDCIYAWLPSVTELSRQAIFRGDIPSENYNQSPASEGKMWREFWDGKHLPAFQQYYQHSGEIGEEASVKRLGYVVVDLDEKMHASDDFMYLYDNTKRWVKEKGIIQNIRHLVEGGYKVFITTDHGNIETTGYRNLDNRDKIGADISRRHITLPKEADKSIFEAQYAGHLVQIDPSSKTYYAKEKEAFTSEDRCVTHGGPHWLEVLIPFITING